MRVYLWLYILGACGTISLGMFLFSLNRDSILLKKLKLKKSKILVNWLLLAVSIICFLLMIYAFIYIQKQINIFNQS
ncbi:hypothetical protein I580_01677 [Enterococcus caccae ATCC BAA-1240]|uniref:Uncharacterized protein n=1 Tax=Enterococcus caccae ATCC BAA-1240 TaxID=1158612 RepID=R3TZ01_9ENTE|nr:hypothetical protein UC7_01375 [Enterococcus caccae ATCC BAA-1240]EOT60777.1 hypothetical protein I580_01677 [Enterococcus caccae ATCC BAA-1240]